MGFEQIRGVIPATHRNLWGGWFPAKVQEDIPGNLLEPGAPIGFRDCNNVVYFQGRLQKVFGYDNVNTTALESGVDITSLYHSQVLSKFVGTVGTKFYENMDDATPDDRTGSITLTDGVQTHMTEWQFETTSLVIGLQQGNAPFKWSGSGDAEDLGGSPPQGRWIANWQNAIWIANTSTEPSSLFFSNLGDPDVWTTNDDYKFDSPITGLGTLGNLLVVFMEDHIGVLSGTNNRVLTKIDRFINSVGCTGGFTIKNAFLEGQEVLVFHGRDGFYAFNGSQQPIKLSNPIDNKYISGTDTSRWNEARFSNAWATYSARYNWYIVGISDGSDTENGFVMILDLSRPYQLPNGQGLAVPHWPISDQTEEVNCITVAKSSAGLEGIYFGSDDGFVYLYDPDTLNRNGSSYTGQATSKIFDLGRDTLLMEVNVLGNESGTTGELEVYINYDLESGDGEGATQDMTAGADVLDSTFILDTSTLGGKEFVFRKFGILNFGRFFQFKLENDDLDHEMSIQGVNFVFKDLGLHPNLPG